MSDKETLNDECVDCSEYTTNKDYIEALQTFYDERLRSQLKDKFKKCANCSENKQFIDKKGQLIFSCGSNSGACGKQMTITLPKYCYYPEMKEDATRILNNLVDLEQFKDLFTKKEINEQIEIKKDNTKLLKKCHKPFSEQNQIKARENLIKKTHRNRIQLKKDQNLLLTRIHNEDDIAKKQNLMKEYLQLNQRIKEEYEELMKSNKPLNQFLVVEEGSVTKGSKQEEEKPKKEDNKEGKIKDTNEGEQICEELSTSKIPKSDQEKYRKDIYDETISKIKGELTVDNLTDKLTTKLFTDMFLLYDKYFFKNKIKDWTTKNACKLTICWGDKCGKDVYGRTFPPIKSKGGTNHIIIQINHKLFIKIIKKFLDNDDETMSKAGVECNDLLSCIQLTLEHELIHGLLFCLCNNYQTGNGPGNWTGSTENKTGHSKTFMSIINNVFGHTNYVGNLEWDKDTLKRMKENSEKYSKLQKDNKVKYNVGDLISFRGNINKKTKIITGHIKKKNPKKIIVVDTTNQNQWNLYYHDILDPNEKDKEDKKEEDAKKDAKKEEDKKEVEKVDKNLIQPLQKLVKQPMNTNTLNIVVAYRNSKDNARKKQLQIFKQQMELIFKDQTKYHLYIVEQESERKDYDKLSDPIKQEGSTMAKFNLGRLKNIGFELAAKENKGVKNAYYVLSDVDLLPSEGLVDDYLKYPKIPIHLGNRGTRYNKDGKDKDFLGGVLSVSKQDFEKANGYPNNFWGWGGEDEALNKRFKSAYIKIEKPKEPVIDLEEYSIKEKMAVLKKDKMKEMQKWEKLDEDKTTWRTNGLSNIDDLYKVEKELKKGNITHYKVFLHVEEEEEEKEEKEDSDSSGFNPNSDE